LAAEQAQAIALARDCRYHLKYDFANATQVNYVFGTNAVPYKALPTVVQSHT